MSKRNQSKPHRTHPFLYSELCLVVSPRVAKRQLRKAINELGHYVSDCILMGSFVFCGTPQGQDYWWDMAQQINRAKRVKAPR